MTQDYGITWQTIQESVKSFTWSTWSPLQHLYVERQEPSMLSTVLVSKSLFQVERDTQIVIAEVLDFQWKKDYMFAMKNDPAHVSTSIIIK